MNQELIFILKTLQSIGIDVCHLINYKCIATSCINCPVYDNRQRWAQPDVVYGYKLIQLGNL